MMAGEDPGSLARRHADNHSPMYSGQRNSAAMRALKKELDNARETRMREQERDTTGASISAHATFLFSITSSIDARTSQYLLQEEKESAEPMASASTAPGSNFPCYA